MGKGDKKSRRGKLIQGSYGIKRPRKKSVSVASIEHDRALKKEKIANEAITEVVEKPKPAKKKAEPKAKTEKKKEVKETAAE